MDEQLEALFADDERPFGKKLEEFKEKEFPSQGDLDELDITINKYLNNIRKNLIKLSQEPININSEIKIENGVYYEDKRILFTSSATTISYTNYLSNLEQIYNKLLQKLPETFLVTELKNDINAIVTCLYDFVDEVYNLNNDEDTKQLIEKKEYDDIYGLYYYVIKRKNYIREENYTIDHNITNLANKYEAVKFYGYSVYQKKSNKMYEKQKAQQKAEQDNQIIKKNILIDEFYSYLQEKDLNKQINTYAFMSIVDFIFDNFEVKQIM